MGTAELFLLAVGLSMDAFAVSATNGMCKKNMGIYMSLATALTFGLFQGAMPVIGYALGNHFAEYINRYAHIIALILLSFIGIKMIIDSFKKDENGSSGSILTIPMLLIQGVATSIDALAVGVSLAAMNVNIVSAASFICCVTFVLSLIAVFIGKKSGDFLSDKAQLIGGAILVGIGAKIFIEHTFF